MKKIIITLRNNILILGGLTFGVDILLDVFDIQPPLILKWIWLGWWGFLSTLLIWAWVEFAKKNKRSSKP